MGRKEGPGGRFINAARKLAADLVERFNKLLAYECDFYSTFLQRH